MKNFKKRIILTIIIMGVLIIIIIYRIKNNAKYEEFEYENIPSAHKLDDYGELEKLEKLEEYKEAEETEKIEEIEEIEGEKKYIILHITGEIMNPGVIKIEEGSRVVDAIDTAGGLTPNADVSKINLAYVLSDGQKLYIPSVEDKNEEEYITHDIGINIIEESNNKKININTATQTELESLSGIGPSTALKIINYRKENGKFKNIEEIKNVPGIGESKFKQIENQICV